MKLKRMFFDDISQIKDIAIKTGTSIFVMPNKMPVEIKDAIILAPEEKTVITIEQVRKVTSSLSLKQTDDRFIIIRPADKLGLESANALLKNLEEPGDKIHYLLITEAPSELPATILSRAAIYFLRERKDDLNIEADEDKKNIAKKLIVASGAGLVLVAEEIAKKKPSPRSYALEILALTIEMLEKSYFITGKMTFVEKLPKFLNAYEKIAANGHIKLQIVSNLC